MNDWYYKNGHKVVGPVSRQELEYLAMIKKVRPSTHVRNGSAGDWRTYKQLRTAATSSQKVVPKSASKAFSVEAVNTETVAAAVSADQPDIVSAVKPDQAGQRRQVSIGVLLGLVVLIAIWLFYDQLPASSVQSQAGNQPTGSDGDNSDLHRYRARPQVRLSLGRRRICSRLICRRRAATHSSSPYLNLRHRMLLLITELPRSAQHQVMVNNNRQKWHRMTLAI